MQNLARPLSLFSALSSLSHRLMTVSNLSSLPNQIISPFIRRNTARCLVPTQSEKIFFHACKKQFRFAPLISPYSRGDFANRLFGETSAEKAALHIRAYRKRSKEDAFNALAVAQQSDTAPGNLDDRIAAPMTRKHPTHYKGGDSLEYQMPDPKNRVYDLQNQGSFQRNRQGDDGGQNSPAGL